MIPCKGGDGRWEVADARAVEQKGVNKELPKTGHSCRWTIATPRWVLANDVTVEELAISLSCVRRG
jgi:hypothetical protein